MRSTSAGFDLTGWPFIETASVRTRTRVRIGQSSLRIHTETVAVVGRGGTKGVFAGGQVPDDERVGHVPGLVIDLDLERPCPHGALAARIRAGLAGAVSRRQQEQAVAGRIDS